MGTGEHQHNSDLAFCEVCTEPINSEDLELICVYCGRPTCSKCALCDQSGDRTCDECCMRCSVCNKVFQDHEIFLCDHCLCTSACKGCMSPKSNYTKCATCTK